MRGPCAGVFCAIVAVVVFAAVPGAVRAKELIEPTRGLGAGRDSTAAFMITSEPPQAPVQLDGDSIGTTPVHQRAVPGAHTVRVGDTEVEVVLRPGRITVLTLFKGRVVVSSRPEAPPQAVRPSDIPIMSQTGRPPVETERRPVEIPAWDRFLTGTSPTF